MQTTATRAILLRRSRLTDTSLIVHWLTESDGRVKTVARGALRPGSPLSGNLDLFFEDEILFARSKRSDLHALREATVIEARAGLRLNPDALFAASYFVELIELTTEPEYPLPEVYDLLRRALTYLDSSPPTLKAITHFEQELARILGFGPEGETPPHILIGKECGRLPKSRPGLLEKIGA